VVLVFDKLKLRLSEVPFIGHVVTAECIVPASDKIKALVEMPTPTDVSGVRRFLGTILIQVSTR